MVMAEYSTFNKKKTEFILVCEFSILFPGWNSFRSVDHVSWRWVQTYFCRWFDTLSLNSELFFISDFSNILLRIACLSLLILSCFWKDGNRFWQNFCDHMDIIWLDSFSRCAESCLQLKCEQLITKSLSKMSPICGAEHFKTALCFFSPTNLHLCPDREDILKINLQQVLSNNNVLFPMLDKTARNPPLKF